MYGNHSRACSKLQKAIAILGIAIVSATVCMFLYWWAFSPVVSRLFISEKCIFQGLKYYQNDAYLQFENGKDFQGILSHFHLPGSGKVIDFYYVDNHVEDNPIYGKMCDIYALDISLPIGEYQDEKNSVITQAVTHQSRGDFVSYALPKLPETDDIVIVVSFCDKAQVVRYIMITELDTTEGFDQVFGMHANLNWDIPS